MITESRSTALKTLLCIVVATLRLTAGEAVPGEVALKAGQEISIDSDKGKLTIKAVSKLQRDFTWNGQTRSLTMWERKESWYGSSGCYYPGPGEHWKDNGGVRRAVVEEGIHRFGNKDEFGKWLAENDEFTHFHFLGDGNIAGWTIVAEREQLNSYVWKILIADRELSKSTWEAVRPKAAEKGG